MLVRGLFHLEGRSIEGGDLGRHEAVVSFIRIRAAIRLGEERSVGAPLHVDGFANDEDVLRRDLETAGSALRWRLDDLFIHFAERLATARGLAVGREELGVFGEASEQTVPIAGAESSQVLLDNLHGRGLFLLVR